MTTLARPMARSPPPQRKPGMRGGQASDRSRSAAWRSRSGWTSSRAPAHPERQRRPERRRVVRAAEWVRNFIRAAGGEAELVATEKHPLVIGEFRASEGADDAPTVIAYGHFDVQPPGAARALGVAAVRADRARRLALRARSRRRQGPALHPAQGRRAARRRGRAARERAVHVRRRGGVGRPLDRRLPRGGRAWRRRVRDLRRAHARAGQARVLRDRDARDRVLPRSGADRGAATCTRASSAARR